MYDTVEEAHQKLDGSVVLFDGKPVQIVQSSGNHGEVVGHFIPLPLKPKTKSQAPSTALLTDPRWDFKKFGSKLGYTTFVGEWKEIDSVFVSRIPTRHSRQGLDQRTVIIRPKLLEERSAPVNWQHVTYEEGFVDSVCGNFSSVKQAFELLVNKPEQYKSLPITRKLLLMWDRVNPPNLIYRGERIGYTENGDLFKLARHKEFLREELVDMENLKIA